MDERTSPQTPGAPAFVVERNANPVDVAERARLLANPGFGRVFTDHMVMIRYNETLGWHDSAASAGDAAKRGARSGAQSSSKGVRRMASPGRRRRPSGALIYHDRAAPVARSAPRSTPPRGEIAALRSG